MVEENGTIKQIHDVNRINETYFALCNVYKTNINWPDICQSVWSDSNLQSTKI